MAAEPLPDGIYFDLPDDAYHAIPRLSCSGIQAILVSPATFWSRSWLNAAKAAVLAATALTTGLAIAETVAAELVAMHGPLPAGAVDQAADETEARTIGRAYHVARLEPDRFESSYVRGLDKAEMPRGTLFTGKDMEAELVKLGQPKSGSVGEQAARLRDAGFPADRLWHIAVAEWEAARGPRTGLPAKVFDEIHTDAERLRASPEVAEKLTGGIAEITILWTCQRTGIPMKARIDHLRADLWTDLKTFANPNGKHLYQAITDAFRYNRYHVQPVVYRDAIESVRTGRVQIVGHATEAQRDLVANLQVRPGELECWYVFQEKGGVPNILARRFKFHHVPIDAIAQAAGLSPERRAASDAAQRTTTALFDKAAADVDRAKRDYLFHLEIFPKPGTPWLPVRPVGDFEDGDFNSYWLDER